MTTTRTRITTVREAVKAVYATMGRYDEFGAYDTEPRAEFSALLRRVAKGEEARVPQNARDWQLFSDMKGSFFAAKSLTRAAERVVKLATASLAGRDELHGYCRDEGWL